MSQGKQLLLNWLTTAIASYENSANHYFDALIKTANETKEVTEDYKNELRRYTRLINLNQDLADELKAILSKIEAVIE